jgi:hypothetical protein
MVEQIVWKQIDQPKLVKKKEVPEYRHEMWRTGGLGVRVRKQDFVFYEGVKLVTTMPDEDGQMTPQPECYGEREFGSFRPRSLGPLGPSGWYIHRLLDWIPAGVLKGQDTVVDDVVRWAILQEDPICREIKTAFPEYLATVQLQLPPLVSDVPYIDERSHRFLVTLRVRTQSPTIARAKDQVIGEIEELMRWPSPMTIEGIGGVQRIPENTPE